MLWGYEHPVFFTYLQDLGVDGRIILKMHLKEVGFRGHGRGAHAHHVNKKNTPKHSILSTALQLSISQKALGTFSDDSNVMPKHVGATIHK
jgi:hypothetical protein